MNRAFSLLFALVFFASAQIAAQDTVRVGKPYGQAFVLPVAARQVCGDALLMTYVLDERGEVFAFDEKGAPMGRFSNEKLGQPARIDASQGALMVWYKDFHTLVWLNSSMTESGRLDLAREANILTADIVAPSSDGNVWLYDGATFQLKKIDRQTGKLLSASPNLSSIFAFGLRPFSLQEHNGQVFMGDPQAGILIFDGLGQYAKALPEKGLSPFFISDNKLNFVADGVIKTMHVRFIGQRKESGLPTGIAESDKPYFINKRRIYAISPAGVEAWIVGMPPEASLKFDKKQ